MNSTRMVVVLLVHWTAIATTRYNSSNLTHQEKKPNIKPHGQHSTQELFKNTSKHSYHNMRPIKGHANSTAYIALADINLAMILPVHTHTNDIWCQGSIRGLVTLQRIEAARYVLQEINERADLLPGLRVGYTIMDDCYAPATALSQVLKLIPRHNSGCYNAGSLRDNDDGGDGSDGGGGSSSEEVDDEKTADNTRGINSYDGYPPDIPCTDCDEPGCKDLDKCKDEPTCDKKKCVACTKFCDSYCDEKCESDTVFSCDLCKLVSTDDAMERCFSLCERLAPIYWPPERRNRTAEVCDMNIKDVMPWYEVAAVVGSESSTNSMELANALNAYKVPVISYSAMASTMSNRDTYPYFYRSTVSDHQLGE